MSEERSQPSARAPRARRRRRWPALAAVAVLALLGRGLGWFGAAPAAQDGDELATDRGARAPADSPASSADRGPSESIGAATTVHEASRDGAPATGANAAPAPASADEASPDGRVGPPTASTTGASRMGASTMGASAMGAADPPKPTLDEDRFESLLALVTLRIGEGALAKARASLAHLARQSLSAAQQDVVRAQREQLDAAAQRAGRELVASLRRGEVLAASDGAARLFGDGEHADDRAHELLGAALPDLGMRGDWRREPALGDAVVPLARPLARDRRVRVRWRDAQHVGAVASNKTDRVTVRIRTDSGQSYPTVARADCEPLDVSPSDAVEMGFACLHAGLPLRARLWYACAHLLADGELDERGRLLGSLLR